MNFYGWVLRQSLKRLVLLSIPFWFLWLVVTAYLPFVGGIVVGYLGALGHAPLLWAIYEKNKEVEANNGEKQEV
jgi:hypothetical protein